MSFDTFGLHRTLLRAIQTLGYTDPTPIQQAAIPAVFTGRDVIGCAQTGTGKTAAYLLPVLHRLLQNATPGPRVLVVLPTRELAVQVDTQRRELTSRTSLRGTAIHGGVPFAPQAHALRANVDVVAATPGRLLDHLARPLHGVIECRCWCSMRPIACLIWAFCRTCGGSCPTSPAASNTAAVCDTPARHRGASRGNVV